MQYFYNAKSLFILLKSAKLMILIYGTWHTSLSHFKKDYITLFFPNSKTDLFCSRVILTVADVKDSIYAIAFFHHFYNYFLKLLFAPLLITLLESFTRNYITSKSHIRLAWLEYISNYSDYLFWHNAATSIKEAGLTDGKIQLQKRWKSDAYLLYI